jgi:Cu-Zn family superoxide dismutase
MKMRDKPHGVRNKHSRAAFAVKDHAQGVRVMTLPKTVTVLSLMMTTALLAGGSVAGAATRAPTAKAVLMAADGTEKGKAQIVQKADGLHVTVWVKGLPAGTHAAHVHTIGTCTAPDFASAGGHWNPMAKQHGKDNPMGMHMGDMPNIILKTNGAGKLDFVIAGGTLTDGSMPLLDADGAAVVIHASPDDMKTDPTGNAGGRIACGVLKLS